MAVKKRGGEQRTWKDNRKGKNAKYQQHLREVTRQGKGFRADGSIGESKEISGTMHDHLIKGYRLGGI